MKKIIKFFSKNANILSSLALLFSVYASRTCFLLLEEEEVPKHLIK